MTLTVGPAHVSMELPQGVSYGYSKVGDGPARLSLTGPLADLQEFCRALLNETLQVSLTDGTNADG